MSDPSRPPPIDYAKPGLAAQPTWRVAASILCLVAGVPFCSLGIALANSDKSTHSDVVAAFFILATGACFCGLGMYLGRRGRSAKSSPAPVSRD